MVVVEGERIKAVGSRAEVALSKGLRIVDGRGRWVMPGLVDAHVHFFQSGGAYTRPDVIDLRAHRSYEQEIAGVKQRLDATFARYLLCGVTSVVDAGGPLWNFEVRDRAARTTLAPRVAVAGPLVSTVARPQLDLGDPPIVKVDSPADARALVAREGRRGSRSSSRSGSSSGRGTTPPRAAPCSTRWWTRPGAQACASPSMPPSSQGARMAVDAGRLHPRPFRLRPAGGRRVRGRRPRQGRALRAHAVRGEGYDLVLSGKLRADRGRGAAWATPTRCAASRS